MEFHICVSIFPHNGLMEDLEAVTAVPVISIKGLKWNKHNLGSCDSGINFCDGS